jgi:hypothetical protein
MGYLLKIFFDPKRKPCAWRRLLAPVFLFHRGQFKCGRVEADDFQIHTAIRAYYNFTLDDTIQGNFGIAFSTMGNDLSRHGFLQNKVNKKKEKPSGMEGSGCTLGQNKRIHYLLTRQ